MIIRGIGRWDLVALMVNVSIGSGILGLPAHLRSDARLQSARSRTVRSARRRHRNLLRGSRQPVHGERRTVSHRAYGARSRARVHHRLAVLNGGFLATTRLPFAFAEQGDLSAIRARVHARFRTPHVAILSSALIVLIATLASSFLAATHAGNEHANGRVHRGMRGAYPAPAVAPTALPAGFVAPWSRGFAIGAIVMSVALLATAPVSELLQLAVAAASGVLIYVLARRKISTGRTGTAGSE